MTAQMIILILSVCLFVCIAVLILGTAYFLRQWRRLDEILDHFRQEDPEDSGGYPDVWETRESRVVSQLHQILAAARFKEQKAAGEKDQVMELISDLSHQLKTPLANIIMNTELLQDPSPGEEQRKEFLTHIRSQADKMRWLMNALLKASRLENGMIHFEAEEAGIKGTIARAVSAVYAQASAKKIELVVEEFRDFPLYHNPKWTAEAMGNILENAVKYAPPGSRIQITLTRLDLYTKILIQDEGIGILEEEFNQIFRRFYRGKGAEQQEGSGLGLYLAQLILKREKGYITVSSNVGEGSCFSLFLLNEAVF
ncbi:MAG: HAMP domain-containing histidine kinase [Lachnospiraceae bacterium]|nr:HAMP domain-containing histidine kinase [Lachnospiraceae bacterium]